MQIFKRVLGFMKNAEEKSLFDVILSNGIKWLFVFWKITKIRSAAGNLSWDATVYA